MILGVVASCGNLSHLSSSERAGGSLQRCTGAEWRPTSSPGSGRTFVQERQGSGQNQPGVGEGRSRVLGNVPLGSEFAFLIHDELILMWQSGVLILPAGLRPITNFFDCQLGQDVPKNDCRSLCNHKKVNGFVLNSAYHRNIDSTSICLMLYLSLLMSLAIAAI